MTAVRKLVIASTTGDTARKASEFFKDTKVCFETVLMVTHAGPTASGETVIVMAGTARGSNSALVMQAASSQHLKRLSIPRRSSPSRSAHSTSTKCWKRDLQEGLWIIRWIRPVDSSVVLSAAH